MMTLTKTTISIMTLSIMILTTTALSITTFGINNTLTNKKNATLGIKNNSS